MKTIRTQKRSSLRNTPSRELEAIARCHNKVCYEIEKERKQFHSWRDLQNTKQVSRWKAGTCKICGEYMACCITNYHASLHGFKNAEEMIEAGAVIFD